MRVTTISQRLRFVLFIIGGLVLSFTCVIGYLSYQVKQSTTEIVKVDLPFALNSLAMLEELGDMNSNLLEYLLGESEEIDEYQANLNELTQFRNNIPMIALNQSDLNKLDALITHHQFVAKTHVFNAYSPQAESNVNDMISRLIEETGEPLERLLDELKNEQVIAARSAIDVSEVLDKYLPTVRYYLELVDEAGDMLADLTRFILGDEDAKYSFSSNADDFQLYLTRLKEIDKNNNESADLEKITQLFTRLKTQGEAIFEQYNSSSKLAAKNTVEQLEHSTFYHAETVLDGMSAQAKLRVEKSINKLSYQSNIALVVISFGVIATIILFISILLYARKKIFQPIDTITSAIKSLRAGDHNLKLPKSNHDDELGRIVNDLIGFQAELIELDSLRSIDAEMRLTLTLERDKATQALSELKAAQHQLIANEKLASLGALVAGVAHEVNTPLGVSVTISTLVSDKLHQFFEDLKSGKLRRSELAEFELQIEESTKLLISSVGQAASLIENFKQVAVDQGSAQRREFYLLELIGQITSTLKHKINNTRIDFLISGDEHLIMDAYPGELTQVITHLFQNSICHGFSTGEVGKITIDVSEQDDDALIVYSDNGCGIKKENISHIFDPFFTTRPGTGEGCGLGLNIVHNIITGLLCGDIQVESELQQGTTFYIKLPKKTPSQIFNKESMK